MNPNIAIERTGVDKFSLSLVFIGILTGLSLIMVSLSFGQEVEVPEISRQAEVIVVQEPAAEQAISEGVA